MCSMFRMLVKKENLKLTYVHTLYPIYQIYSINKITSFIFKYHMRSDIIFRISAKDKMYVRYFSLVKYSK